MKANHALASHPATLRTSRGHDVLVTRMVFIACFIAILPVAIAAALVGWRWQPWPPGAHGYRPVLSEAQSTAKVMTATVFSI